MRVDVLGGLRVDDNQVALRPRSRIVLAALAVHRDRTVSPDELAAAVWGDGPLPRSWPKQVQYCIWDLRKALGTEAIETVDGAYRLRAGPEGLDVTDFETLVAQGRHFAATGEADRAASSFTRALGLWRGVPFQDLDGWMPGRHEAGRLEELRRSAEEEQVEARLAAGDHRDVVALAERRAAEEPLRERRWAQLALAQYRCGNQADALRSLRRARHTLVEQLGIEPGAELVALEAAILAQDPELERSAAGLTQQRCPYKGLLPYDADDADLFFGRDDEIAAALARLDAVRLLAVAGPSGSGKSSLARAGIVPALRRRGVPVVVFVPGADPDAALSQALASVPGDPVVVVDQLEELFARGQSPDAEQAFCERLAEYARERARVIVTIRSDHLGDLAAQPSLARLVEHGLYLVGPLSGDALRTTIQAPAAAAGLRLETGLVDLLVREVEGEPAALPLLSHALAETWQRRDGRVLTVDGYRATGEIRGAVARSAEQLYASLPAAQQQRLRALLLRLVVPTTGGEPVRAHLDRRRLDTDAERRLVLDQLVRARLVTADESSVELAHEAVARAWPRLRGWLDDDAAGQRVMHHLSTAADDWDALGRPHAELYRGGRLETALEWRDTSSPDLTEVEEAFLDASAEAAESERRALAAEARRQARQNRRLRWALGAAAVLLVASVAGGAVALAQRQEARQQRREAALNALVGDSMALRANRRDLAALLAVEAHRLGPNAESESALFGTFTAAAGAEQILHTGLSLATLGTDAAFLPDGRTVVIGDEKAAMRLIDLDTGQTADLPALSEENGRPILAVSADGRYLAAGWRPHDNPPTGIFTVWDLETHEQRFAPVTVDFHIGDIAINADGSTVAVGGGTEMRAVLFEGATGGQRAEAERLEAPADHRITVGTAPVKFGPDGRLAVGSLTGVTRIIEPDTGAEVRRFEGPEESSMGFIGFLDGGRDIVTAGEPVVRYDASTGETRWTSRRPPEEYSCNTWATAERIGALLCGEHTGRVTAFDLETGAELGWLLDSQQGDVCGLAVSPDGTRVVQVAACQSDNVTLVEWRLDGGGPVSRLVLDTPAERGVNGFGFQGTDALVVEHQVQDDKWRTSVVDPVEGKEMRSFEGVFVLYPTSDPALAVGIYDDGEAPPAFGLFDTRRREPAGPIIDPGIELARWWTDGRIAVVFDGTSELRTFELASGRRIEPTIDVSELEAVDDVVITEDSLYVAVELTVDQQPPWRIQRRDRSTGVVLAETQGSNFWGFAVGGGVAVGAASDGRLVELDPTTLEPVGAPFPGTNGPVRNLAIDDRGHRLVVRAGDGTLRFLDIATRTQLGDPIDTGRYAGNATIRPDGLAAATVTDQGIVVWDLDPAHWAEAACELAGRNMTREEWDRYLGDLGDYRATCDQYPHAD